MSDILDFTETARWSIPSAVDERWGPGSVEPRPADIESRVIPDARPRECPDLFRRADQCSFVAPNTGENCSCSRIFYQDLEQFGTGIEEFANAADATVTLRRMQADYESDRSGAYPDGGARS